MTETTNKPQFNEEAIISQMKETLTTAYGRISIEHKNGLLAIREELLTDVEYVEHESTVQVIKDYVEHIDEMMGMYKRREVVFLGKGEFDFIEHELTDEEIENPELFIPGLIEDGIRVMKELIMYKKLPQAEE